MNLTKEVIRSKRAERQPRMKYIVLDMAGTEFPVIFPDHPTVSHARMAEVVRRVRVGPASNWRRGSNGHCFCRVHQERWLLLRAQRVLGCRFPSARCRADSESDVATILGQKYQQKAIVKGDDMQKGPRWQKRCRACLLWKNKRKFKLGSLICNTCLNS